MKSFSTSEKSKTKSMNRGLFKKVTDNTANSGRKPNERPRKRKSCSISAQFCDREYEHDEHVTFKLLSMNPRVKKCYVCKAEFDRMLDELVACAKTYRLYKDAATGNLMVSKHMQNVYAHLACMRHKDFQKPSHICNYIDLILSADQVKLIEKYSV